MVLRQLLLPKEGGGSLRRFIGMRQRLYRDQWQDNRPLRGPVPLFDFRRRDDAADVRDSLRPDRMRGLFGGWRVSDDSVIGGYSTSKMEFKESSIASETNDDNNDREEETDCDDNESKSSTPPFLRWSGTISTEINRQSQLARNVTRSGFAAILSPEYPYSAPLGNKYKALEICCRTDGRTYAVNLHVETMFPEDMYQGFLIGGTGSTEYNYNNSNRLEEQLSQEQHFKTTTTTTDDGNEQSIEEELEQPEPSLDVREHLQNRRNLIRKTTLSSDDHPYYGHPPLGFQRYILPFKDFALTSRGRMRLNQRDLDGAVNIESIGFTLMDGKDGDFCFDLVSLRAVNVLQGEVVSNLEDTKREEEFEDRIILSKIEKKENDDEVDSKLSNKL